MDSWLMWWSLAVYVRLLLWNCVTLFLYTDAVHQLGIFVWHAHMILFLFISCSVLSRKPPPSCDCTQYYSVHCCPCCGHFCCHLVLPTWVTVYAEILKHWFRLIRCVCVCVCVHVCAFLGWSHFIFMHNFNYNEYRYCSYNSKQVS